MSTQVSEEAAQPIESSRVNRRQFLVGATGGFILHFCLPGQPRFAQAASVRPPTQFNSYIQINADSTATVFFGGCELGQGAMSGLTQLAAEELMLDWSKVTTQTALAGSLSYITGGSSAIRVNYLPLRHAGAAVRMMLVQAAANTWAVPVTQCVAGNGNVIHTPTKRVLAYGELAPSAAKLAPPTNPILIPDAKLRLIGKPVQRLDLPNKVNGRAVYGMDVRVPNMLYAVVRHCPSLGGTLSRAPDNPGGGVVAVVPLGNAVAMVADNTWNAMSGFDQSNINWNVPASSRNIDSKVFAKEAARHHREGPRGSCRDHWECGDRVWPARPKCWRPPITFLTLHTLVWRC